MAGRGTSPWRSVGLGLLGAVILVGAALIIDRTLDFPPSPWQDEALPLVIRPSKARSDRLQYVVSQQKNLQELYARYVVASTVLERVAIAREMQTIATTIPDNVPPDVQTVLRGLR